MLLVDPHPHPMRQPGDRIEGNIDTSIGTSFCATIEFENNARLSMVLIANWGHLNHQPFHLWTNHGLFVCCSMNPYFYQRSVIDILK